MKSILLILSITLSATFAMPNSSRQTQVCPSDNICGLDGECVVTTHPLVEYKYACKCTDGSYKFERCLSVPTIRNSCASSPCGTFQCLVTSSFASGYVCVCGVNDYRLSCSSTITAPAGLTLTLCPINVCQNSGICIVNGTTLSCVCKDGFTGVFCESSATIIIPTVAATTTSSVVLCQNQNTCSNQGVCYLVSGVIRCICPQGFTGALCESVVTTPTTAATTIATTAPPSYVLCTNQNTCRNQGVCYIVVNSVVCICPEGFTGQLCENMIAASTVAPATTTTSSSGIALCQNQNICQNLGVCYLVNGVTRCVCPQGYTGTLCETIASVIGTTVAANGCTINPCQNGGTCVTQPNGAFLGCFCTTGFIGTNCQIASGAGTGTGLNTCAAGRTGANCETVYFSCSSNGRFKDQYLCSSGKYLECVYFGLAGTPNGILYVRDCSSGLRYNQATDQCDFAVNIQC